MRWNGHYKNSFVEAKVNGLKLSRLHLVIKDLLLLYVRSLEVENQTMLFCDIKRTNDFLPNVRYNSSVKI